MVDCVVDYCSCRNMDFLVLFKASDANKPQPWWLDGGVFGRCGVAGY